MVEPSGHCPYLGLKQNQAIRFASPTPEHRCYATGQAQDIPTIQPDYQATYCLSPGHVKCPLYTGIGLPSTATATQVPVRPVATAGGLSAWLGGLAPLDRAIYGVLLALLGVILAVYAVAGFGLLNGNSIFGGSGPFAPVVDTPTNTASTTLPSPSASSSPTGSPTGTATASPSASSSPTGSPTRSPTGTATASPSASSSPSIAPTNTVIPSPTATQFIYIPPPPTFTPAVLEPLPSDTPQLPTDTPEPSSTSEPTAEPTFEPTATEPTFEPTAEATAEPTGEPAPEAPTDTPPEATPETRRTPDPQPPAEG